MSARSSRGIAAQPGKACCAAATAWATSGAAPAATSASGCSSMGETSVKVRVDATRWPPIQCRVLTVTPSTTAVSGMSGHLRRILGGQVVVQQAATVPYHADLPVVTADYLLRRQPVEFFPRGRKQLESVYPGPERRTALGAGRRRGDDLVEPELRRI